MARVAQLYEQVRKGRDVRANLIALRENISDESLRRSFQAMLDGDYSVLTGLLEAEDPKVRRNAALILGRTGDSAVLPYLVRAWEKEETLYIREDYLKAMSLLDYRDALPKLSARLEKLQKHEEAPEDEEAREESNPLWDNDRHLLAEQSRLREMISRYEDTQKHEFLHSRRDPAPDLLLVTNRLHADVTARRITKGSVRAMKGAVYVKGGSLDEIAGVRTWIELLFPIPGAKSVGGDERAIAQKLRDMKIGNYLRFLHGESTQPFRYRIELKSRSIPREKKGEMIRRIAQRLDALERGSLMNSDSDYEVELRLIERADGTFQPILKLFTLPDERFSYRKQVTAQSTAAPLAALTVELARPYLREGVQVLDPFCGVGTLLIERSFVPGADPLYGVDRFAEAVEKARGNTASAQALREKTAPAKDRPEDLPARENFYYINRDFFDFTHDYRFDELITELPRLRKEESGAFAERFMEKAGELLKEDALMVVLTDDPAGLKAAAEKDGHFRTEREEILNERAGSTCLILKAGQSVK